MISENFKIGSDAKKRLLAKPEMAREEAELMDLRKTEVKTVEFIQAKVEARNKLFNRKSFLR